MGAGAEEKGIELKLLRVLERELRKHKNTEVLKGKSLRRVVSVSSVVGLRSASVLKVYNVVKEIMINV